MFIKNVCNFVYINILLIVDYYEYHKKMYCMCSYLGLGLFK